MHEGHKEEWYVTDEECVISPTMVGVMRKTLTGRGSGKEWICSIPGRRTGMGVATGRSGGKVASSEVEKAIWK